jgi:hypothetical protein
MDPAHDVPAQADLCLPPDADVLQVEQLQALLQRLDARATSVLDSMNAVLQSHQPEFTGVFENSRDLGRRVMQLQDELRHNVAAIAAADSVQGVQVTARAQAEQQRAQLRHIQSTVRALTHLNELKDLLESADEAMGVGNRFDAVRAADELEKCSTPFAALQEDIRQDSDTAATTPTSSSKAKSAADTHWSQSQVLRAVETQIRRRKTKLRMRMEQVLAAAVVISPGSLSVRNHALAALSTRSRPFSLGDVLHCLGTLGVLDTKLAALAPQLLSHIFSKLLTPPSFQALSETDSTPTSAVKFTPQPGRAGAPQVQSVVQGNSARLAIVHDEDVTSSTGASLTVRMGTDASSGTGATPPTSTMSLTDLSAIFDDVAQTIEFLHSHLANKNPDLMRALAKSLWLPCGRSLSAGIAVGLVRAVRRTVPHASQDAQSICLQVQNAAEAFEARLVEIGFLDPSDTSAVDALDTYVSSYPRATDSQSSSGVGSATVQGTAAAATTNAASGSANVELSKALAANPRARVLTPFARDMDRHIALARRAFLLDRARAICAEEYPRAQSARQSSSRFPALIHIQTQERSVLADSPGAQPLSSSNVGEVVYQLPDMQVSTAVVESMALVHSTMEEAASLTHLVASSTLYHTARDICVLLEAVLPLIHEQRFVTESTASMIFHNDLVYVVHHLAVLAHAFRDSFAVPALRPRIVTVDLIPALRKHADTVLRSQVDKQTRMLVDLARTIPDLRLLPDELARFEQVFTEAITLYSKTNAEWAKVLSLQDLGRCAAHIADEFIAVMLDKIRLLKSASMPSGRELDERDVRNLHFFYQALNDKVMRIVDGQGKVVSLHKYVQRGGKQLAAVVRVLEPHVTLSAFEDMRVRGVLASVDPDLLDALRVARFGAPKR